MRLFITKDLLGYVHLFLTPKERIIIDYLCYIQKKTVDYIALYCSTCTHFVLLKR